MERRTTRIIGALGALAADMVAGIIVSISLVSAPACANSGAYETSAHPNHLGVP